MHIRSNLSWREVRSSLGVFSSKSKGIMDIHRAVSSRSDLAIAAAHRIAMRPQPKWKEAECAPSLLYNRRYICMYYMDSSMYVLPGRVYHGSLHLVISLDEIFGFATWKEWEGCNVPLSWSPPQISTAFWYIFEIWRARFSSLLLSLSLFLSLSRALHSIH